MPVRSVHFVVHLSSTLFNSAVLRARRVVGLCKGNAHSLGRDTKTLSIVFEVTDACVAPMRNKIAYAYGNVKMSGNLYTYRVADRSET